jgi:DNA invertase Pin-like site-specific DNA recombinase
VNPLHLLPGTYSENRYDAVQRGQWRMKNPARGERNANARLTWVQVREMRRLRLTGMTLVALARMFGVSHPTVSRIARGQTWREENE